MTKRIGIFGGTFDPIHNGHLHLVLACLKELSLDEVKLIPLNIPAHRDLPQSNNTHRLSMLKLAIKEYKTLNVDTRELDQEQTSYTVNTLRSLRNEFPDEALYLIVGADAFAKFDTWKDWQEIIGLANIVIAKRPEHVIQPSEELENWVQNLKDKPCQQGGLYGTLYEIQTDMLAISSTTIRQQISQDGTSNKLPAKVLDYILTHNLYS